MAFWSLILIALRACTTGKGRSLADRRQDDGSDAADRRVFADDEGLFRQPVRAISSLDKWPADLCYASNLSIAESTQFPKVHHARISHP